MPLVMAACPWRTESDHFEDAVGSSAVGKGTGSASGSMVMPSTMVGFVGGV